MTASIAPTYVNEAGVKGVTRLASTRPLWCRSRPRRSALHKELLTFMPQGGMAFLSAELRRALSVTVDTVFFNAIESGSP